MFDHNSLTEARRLMQQYLKEINELEFKWSDGRVLTVEEMADLLKAMVDGTDSESDAAYKKVEEVVLDDSALKGIMTPSLIGLWKKEKEIPLAVFLYLCLGDDSSSSELLTKMNFCAEYIIRQGFLSRGDTGEDLAYTQALLSTKTFVLSGAMAVRYKLESGRMNGTERAEFDRYLLDDMFEKKIGVRVYSFMAALPAEKALMELRRAIFSLLERYPSVCVHEDRELAKVDFAAITDEMVREFSGLFNGLLVNALRDNPEIFGKFSHDIQEYTLVTLLGFPQETATFIINLNNALQVLEREKIVGGELVVSSLQDRLTTLIGRLTAALSGAVSSSSDTATSAETIEALGILRRDFLSLRIHHSDIFKLLPSGVQRYMRTQTYAVIALDFDGVISDVGKFLDYIDPVKNYDARDRGRIIESIKTSIREAFSKASVGSDGVIVTGSISEGGDVYAFWCSEADKNTLLDIMEGSEFYSTFSGLLAGSRGQGVFIDNIPLLREYLEAFSQNSVCCVPATNRLANAACALSSERKANFHGVETALAALNRAFGADRSFFTLTQSTNIMSAPPVASGTESVAVPCETSLFVSELTVAGERDEKFVLLGVMQQVCGLTKVEKKDVYFLDDDQAHVDAVQKGGYTALRVSSGEGGRLTDHLQTLASKLLSPEAQLKLTRGMLALEREKFHRSSEYICCDMFEENETIVGIDNVIHGLRENADFLERSGLLDSAQQLLDSALSVCRAVNVALNASGKETADRALSAALVAAAQTLGNPALGGMEDRELYSTISLSTSVLGSAHAVFELISWLEANVKKISEEKGSEEKVSATRSLVGKLRGVATKHLSLKSGSGSRNVDLRVFLTEARNTVGEALKTDALVDHRTLAGKIWAVITKVVAFIFMSAAIGASQTKRHLLTAEKQIGKAVPKEMRTSSRGEDSSSSDQDTRTPVST